MLAVTVRRIYPLLLSGILFYFLLFVFLGSYDITRKAKKDIHFSLQFLNSLVPDLSVVQMAPRPEVQWPCGLLQPLGRASATNASDSSLWSRHQKGSCSCKSQHLPKALDKGIVLKSHSASCYDFIVFLDSGLLEALGSGPRKTWIRKTSLLNHEQKLLVRRLYRVLITGLLGFKEFEPWLIY